MDENWSNNSSFIGLYWLHSPHDSQKGKWTINFSFNFYQNSLCQAYPLPSHLSVNWELCSTNEPMDFIDMSLFGFVFAVTGFLIVGTFLHRVETLGHIIRTTSVRKKSSGKEGKQKNTVAVTHVDSDVMA